MKIGAVLLAAGASSRFGAPKQLVEIGGETLVARVARDLISAGCDPVIVVTGANQELVRAATEGIPIHLGVNSGWEAGMGTSIRCGVDAALAVEPVLDAILLALCDQPRVRAAHFGSLMKAFRDSGKTVAAAAYGGTVGAPAVFGRALLPELLAMAGDQGARKLLQKRRASVEEFPLPEALLDIDTPSDLLKLFE